MMQGTGTLDFRYYKEIEASENCDDEYASDAVNGLPGHLTLALGSSSSRHRRQSEPPLFTKPRRSIIAPVGVLPEPGRHKGTLQP
jgi:hypothetical protein